MPAPEDGRVAGGPAAVAELSELLGLGAESSSPWRVAGVAACGRGAVSVKLSGGGRPAGIVLRPASREGGFVRAGALDLCYEGRAADPSLLALLRDLSKRLRRVRPGRLEAIVLEDPASRPELPAGGSVPDGQCVSDRLGGNPGQWRRFFCGKEFRRQFHWAHATGFADRILYITHGDFDCTFMPPDMTFRGMTFLNYPPVHPHSRQSRLPDTVYDQRTTDLKERDVVMGTAAKLSAVEEAVKAKAGSVDAVMISWSCTPTVIGDDEGAMAEKLRRATGLPVAMNSINFRMQESFSLFEEFFRHVRGLPAFGKAAPRPDAVNIVDCPKTYFDEELAGQLAALGLAVNARVFPDIHLASLERYLEAGCQVIPEHLRGMKTLERALGGLPIKTVYALAPYGLEGCRSFLKAVAEGTGREASFKKSWDGVWQGIRPRWEELRREARSHRLAFVASREDLPLLLRPAFQTGVPVLRMLGEMGFGVDFLVFDSAGTAGAAESLRALPWFDSRPGLRFFRSPAELGRLLSAGKWRAVYSDIRFDHRLTEAGKAQFSMRLFEPGLAGAVRTLESLLGVCRLPFYERYGALLRRIPRGRDV